MHIRLARVVHSDASNIIRPHVEIILKFFFSFFCWIRRGQELLASLVDQVGSFFRTIEKVFFRPKVEEENESSIPN